MKQNQDNMWISEDRMGWHCENAELVGKITPKLVALEVSLRNKIDFIMLGEKDQFYLEKYMLKKIMDKDFEASQEQLEFMKKHFHNQFLSKTNLGFWCKLARNERIQNKILDLKKFDFLKYSTFNINDANKILNFKKVNATLNLLSTIRNRAFHCENLLKLKEDKPRIATMVYQENIVINISPERIEGFLSDLVCEFK